MFSTLLGLLPTVTAEAAAVHPSLDAAPSERDAGSAAHDDVEFVLGELAAAGLELLATGQPRPPIDSPASDVVRLWQSASSATDRPVKQVLRGPYSEGRDGARTRPVELAERLRETIEALADAGCPFVEIDEPDALAIGVVDGERHRFTEAHRRLADDATRTHLSLALTGGNLDAAGAATFFDRGYASFAFDLIAGPDNWRLIAHAPEDRGIVCGALDPRPGGDETPELLVWAAHYAASTMGRGIERVGLANAPSLADVPWSVAARKLGRVVEAARIAGVDSESELAQLLDPRALAGRATRRKTAPRGGAEPT